MTPLDGWENFYVIVGSSAGALIGLQFVVLTLIAARPQMGSPEAGAAFATPSVVHFAVVLLLSAVLSAPWQTIGAVAIFCGLAGLSGIAYTAVVIRRMRVQKAYRPVLEDWLFHAVLPLAAYAILGISALIAESSARLALFFVGGATLIFLFVGIHNAWDAITYHIFVNMPKERDHNENRSDQ